MLKEKGKKKKRKKKRRQPAQQILFLKRNEFPLRISISFRRCYTSEERNARNLPRKTHEALATRGRVPASRSIFTTWQVIFIVFTDPDFLRLGRDTRDRHEREACNPLPAGTVLRFLARVRNVPSPRAFVSSELLLLPTLSVHSTSSNVARHRCVY